MKILIFQFSNKTKKLKFDKRLFGFINFQFSNEI